MTEGGKLPACGALDRPGDLEGVEGTVWAVACNSMQNNL